MIETFLLIYAISVVYALLERDEKKDLFSAFQEAFLLTSSFLMVVHILSSPNTAYLITNLSPVVVLVYGVVKKIRAGLKKKTEEKEIGALRQAGGATHSPKSQHLSPPDTSHPRPVLGEGIIPQGLEENGRTDAK